MHLVLHTYVHPPRARDAGLSPREERRLAELEARKDLTGEELAELRDLKFMRGPQHGPQRDAWTREALEKKDLLTLRNVAKYAGVRGWLTAPRDELVETILKMQEGYHYAGDASLHVDVTYARGPFGREEKSERHYVVAEPAGSAGGVSSSRHGPDAVRAELRKIPEHRAMLQAGWTAERIEGYNRDGGDVEHLVEFTYIDGTSEIVRVRAPEGSGRSFVVERATGERLVKSKRVRGVTVNEQLRLFDGVAD